MKLKLNNKGYMLVEIILASALAFGLTFFIIDLTIKLKNKNDDLVVETLISTDREIINNKLMDYAKEEEENFDCSKLTIENNMIKYDGNIIDIVNDYGNIESDKKECSTDLGKISIKIPINVPQMPDKEYNIIFDYKYEIGDMIAPTCSLSIEGNAIKATYSDNEGGSGIKEYGINNTNTVDYNEKDSIDLSVGEFYCYVKDNADNEGSSQLEVIKTTAKVVGTECTQWIPYCNYSCYGFAEKYFEYYNVEWCINPNPSRCGQMDSWSECGKEKNIYDYICSSDYKKLNNSYCYK